MNKAFVREPEMDGRAYCPRCGSLGTEVGGAAIEAHCRTEVLGRIRESGWFCSYPRCDVVYFNQLEVTITTEEIQGPIYPKDPDAPLCACFGFTLDDLEADLREGVPRRIRELLVRSQSAEARCATAAADGRCCMREIQRLYMKQRGSSPS